MFNPLNMSNNMLNVHDSTISNENIFPKHLLPNLQENLEDIRFW